MRLHTIFTAILLLSGLLSYTQPVLVQDINPGLYSATPSRLAVFKGELYFFAADGKNGHELWRTGTGNNPELTLDIYRGTIDAAPNFANKKMAVVNNKLYFPASNAQSGLELFEYDWGTLKLTSDIRHGESSCDIDDIAALDGKVYFDADNGVFGKELWQYNPATQKAECVSFIAVGHQSSDPDWLTPATGKLYFTADDGTSGRELYEYTPATNLATRIADINPGAQGSNPSSLVMAGNTLYFSAYEPTTGRELYSYDGSSVTRLTDLNSGSSNGLAEDVRGLATIGYIGNKIYFAGDDGSTGFQLYTFDLGTQSTTLIATINPAGDATPAGFIYAPDKIFFTADDGTHGREVFKMGNNNIPVMLADINTDPVVDIHPANLTVYNNTLYFTAYGASGNELYSYNDFPASIADAEKQLEATGYPNPTHDVFNLQVTVNNVQTYAVRMLDAAGRIVYQATVHMATGKHTIPVNISALPGGMYFYHISAANGQTIAVGRMVKQ